MTYAIRGVRRTRDEVAVYNRIVEFKREHDGLSPTRREICDGTGITSTSVCNRVLDSLERLGHIALWDDTPRGIMVKGGKWTLEENGDN